MVVELSETIARWLMVLIFSLVHIISSISLKVLLCVVNTALLNVPQIKLLVAALHKDAVVLIMAAANSATSRLSH